ncbi:NAD(P)-binding domain-containing protein [Neobacillus pocheonensis]|uniref:NAD(P)-binding domain-containing protein n=1 Tax=Neobacillus pocheonensis TaxID=363869 RepID=A0ABT0W9W1_9BACI|nr:NAD(P)-binding domain-containing protein [Neobacillus pocheonensis]
MTKEIGFIGLGNMGQPMVMNLLKAGFKVKVYNRTPNKAEDVVAAGAQQVNRPKDLVIPGGIIITMVANDQALEEVVMGPDGFGENWERVAFIYQ